MQCPKCGVINADSNKFCMSCGADMSMGGNPAVMPVKDNNGSQGEFYNDTNYISSTGARGFVSGREKALYSLKNGMINNILSGEGLLKEDAIITDQRLYYTYVKGIINVTRAEEMVDLRDITGTKIANYNPLGILIVSIIFAVLGLLLLFVVALAGIYLLLAGIIGIITYFIARKSFLKIDYAGGSIRFSVKKYGLDKVRAFQRSIHAAKARL